MIHPVIALLNKYNAREERFDRLQELIYTYGNSEGQLVVANLYINDRWVSITQQHMEDIFERLLVVARHKRLINPVQYRLHCMLANSQTGYNLFYGMALHEDGYLYFGNTLFPFRDELPTLCYRDASHNVRVEFTLKTRYRESSFR